MDITTVSGLRKFLKAGGNVFASITVNGQTLNAPLVKKQFVTKLEKFEGPESLEATVDGDMNIYIGQ